MDVIIILFFLALFVVFLFTLIIEPTYILLFNRPVYVHFYPVKHELDANDKRVLRNNFTFYKRLSEKRKTYFEHRVATFINKYTFMGRNELDVTREMQLKIAATAIMLTFGMRRYLHSTFRVIIIYPDAFLSRTGNYHKGEFNPLAGAVVFSWKHFEEGLYHDNDNINLGLHEFAHVLHLDAKRRRRIGSSLVIFSDTLDKIWHYIQHPENREALLESNYLRSYAYTNRFEFTAVLLEHFFETPHELRQHFPKLYVYVRSMINYREG
ncbi:zinc-dependent peptidase [Flavobacterium litorale]|uniref:Zinc-dependent peptidase n=1 Tax=Flavobacterium litorale TaxID=2856519 RepID=A0ABX8V4V9_9FLAO|nr:zinc-dependent peptidase [Flavobacterium litorale]QYJ67163.1 zinc-dependent peptidase [Flavobacterium litorale]